jgi:NAD(P)-dependent dehydrogenase (short-subunit alcohol dehydrogenase family)
LVDRNALALAECVESLRSKLATDIHGLVLDLTEPDAAQRVTDFVARATGRIDILVNNAGLSRAPRIGEVDIADWNAVLQINLTVPMLLSQEAMVFWRDGAGGRIINIGSRVWVSGSGPAYTASKAGLIGLTRSMAVQLGPLAVTVNAVAPSFIDTPFNGGSGHAAVARSIEANLRLGLLPRLCTPEDVAATANFLASDEAGFITGEVIHVCGGAQLAGRPGMFG